EFGEGILTLEPGDLLLLYTDGLTTAETDYGRTGLDPTLELLRQALPLDELVERLMRTAVPPDGEPSDDVAALAAQRKERWVPVGGAPIPPLLRRAPFALLRFLRLRLQAGEGT